MARHVLLTNLWITAAVAWSSAGGWAGEPVRVLTDGPEAGRYLVWRGRPILPIGDSVTQGWMESGVNFDQRAYLEALAARGINVTLIWAYIATSADGQRDDPRLGYDAPEIWPWQGSPDQGTFDLLQFNAAYFARLKEFVALAERLGILVVITVQDGWPKTRFGGHPFNAALGNGPLTDRRQFVELARYDAEMPERFDPQWSRPEQNQYFQERFAERLIRELAGSSNVIFEMFNEGEWYDPEQRLRHEEHFLRFFGGRTTAPLMTNVDHLRVNRKQVHWDALRRNPDADILSVHPMGWTGKFDQYAAEFCRAPAKPIFQSEPVPDFDGANLTLDEIRTSLWERVLSGVGWVAQNDTSFGYDPHSLMAKQTAIRDRALDQIGHAARWLHRSGIAFWRMRPHAALSSSGICLAEPGAEYLVYAPQGGRLRLDLSAVADRAVRAQWFNPRSGEVIQVEPFHAAATTGIDCPDQHDWVLRVWNVGR